MKKTLPLILLVLILGGCTLPGNLLFDPPEELPGYIIPTVEAPALNPTDTAVEDEESYDCAWAWATEPLLEETTALQEALRESGIIGVEGSAAAYGENCLDPVTNTIMRFAVMQTDFYFNVSMENPTDRQQMGEMAERLLMLVSQFPPGDVPGPNKGYIGIHYSNGIQDTHLWLRLEDAERALREGLRGEALFEALDQY
jgi:hypothetical protein